MEEEKGGGRGDKLEEEEGRRIADKLEGGGERRES